MVTRSVMSRPDSMIVLKWLLIWFVNVLESLSIAACINDAGVLDFWPSEKFVCWMVATTLLLNASIARMVYVSVFLKSRELRSVCKL